MSDNRLLWITILTFRNPSIALLINTEMVDYLHDTKG